MTDDPTRPIEATPPEPGPGVMNEGPTTVESWTPPGEAVGAVPAGTEPGVPGRGTNRMRWALGLGLAGVAIAAGIAAVILFGSPATPEALKYLPSDAALVAELRMDLPGDQMQALGNLLAHFPGFQDQATLTDKIDQALSRAIARMPDASGVDYPTEVKPLLTGPLFVGVRSFGDMVTNREPTNAVMVATTNGGLTCAKAFENQTLTHETYRNVELSLASTSKAACAVDGRFFLVGDPAGVKMALDAHANGTGIDTSARYKAARAGLGLDRLATLYVDGSSLAAALPSANPGNPLGDVAAALPEWMIGGVRAENDALVVDMVVAPPTRAAPVPSLRTYAPVHPLALTALAPADALAFGELQGSPISIHNLLIQLQKDPRFAEALKSLDQVGGMDGLIGWIDDLGFVVVRQGDTPAGAVLLVAHDAAAATEKVTTLGTVLNLAALGGNVKVTESTVEGVKVTTVHITDISALLGSAVPGGVGALPPVALDLSIAAKDRVVVLGVGTGVMERLLAVKAGQGLADDAAFRNAVSRSLPNPQSFIYVATGTTLDWIQASMASLGAPEWPADAKAYLDPLQGLAMSATGDGTHGSMRLVITVTKP